MGRKGGRGRGGGRAKGTRKPRPLVTGIVRLYRSGMADLECAEGTFPIARGGLNEAMGGDEVQASLVERRGRGKVAIVRSVTTRATTSFLGTYAQAGPLGAVTPLDARVRNDFFVVPEDESPNRLGVAEGDLVRCRVVSYPTRYSAGIVTLEERVGEAAGLDLAMESVVASFGLPGDFPVSCLDQVAGLADDVEGALEGQPWRLDLRDRLAVTVDPADARDFDDAVAARRVEGGFELDVHIADVTHYLPWGSPADCEARRRTCSAYLADRVIPMLPERLCNDLCSLVPGQDRLAMSVMVRLDERGEVRGVDMAPSAIRSKARLDYDTVQALLEGRAGEGSLACVGARQEDVAECLRTLDQVAGLRRDLRRQRGAIDFETREAKVVLDEGGRPAGVRVRERNRATSLVEEAMLLANECVAAELASHDLPAAYRVHERPAPDDLKATLPVLRELGLVGPGMADRLVAGDSFAIQEVLGAAQGTPGEFMVSSVLLRAQRRAVYLPHNEGHYALGARAYCHFTSPIRRYPDVLVHRALKALLTGQPQWPQRREAEAALPQLCRTCSDLERVADAAARASQKVKMAELYEGRLGEEAWGTVVGVERFGLFVELDETCAEGLLPTRSLGEGWCAFDEARMTLTGEASGRTWRPGQRLRVRVVAADPAQGHIDLAPAWRVAPAGEG